MPFTRSSQLSYTPERRSIIIYGHFAVKETALSPPLTPSSQSRSDEGDNAESDNPHADDQGKADPSQSSIVCRLPRPFAILGQELLWNRLEGEEDAERNNHEIVEEAEDRNEIRDEVEGTQCIGDREEDKEAAVPGDSRVPVGIGEGDDLPPKRLRPFPKPLLHTAAPPPLRLPGRGAL